ncbi:hypothetical protein ABT297_11020 [Dactylosporangium sp. NPDC000555]|uniref:hypothetical protein n=1 Tax=Dactylosporangium sp. NPDC000555 TaxID=3154260 RepID=UPI003319C29D
MTTRPLFTDAEVAALAAVHAEILAGLDAGIDQPAAAVRRVPARLVRLRFPGAVLALAGVVTARLLHSPVAVLLFGGAAAVFVALIAVNARWDSARVLRPRDGGER